MKTRYAFVALAALMLALAAANLLFTAAQVSASDHKFCQVVSGFTAVPIPDPTDPAANPSRVQSYEWYVRFKSLGQSLGC
jgi:hypothetical protein